MFSLKIPIAAERDPKTGLIPCLECTQCCHYVAVEIDTPEDRKDFDNIRWYLYHAGVEVYIDHEETWNVLFHTKCENLLSDGKCAVYETRPNICRDFEADTCEPNTQEPAEQVLLRTADDLEQWMRLSRTDARLAMKEAAKDRKRGKGKGKGQGKGKGGQNGGQAGQGAATNLAGKAR